MSHHIIDLQDVHYRYPDGTQALSGISFRIVHGEAVGIVGANGAGKSTLLLQIGGTLLPTAGSIRIGEIVLSKKTVKEIRKKIGFVFQDPDDQIFMPTVFEDVAFGPLHLGWTLDNVEQSALKALEKVNCKHLKDRPPHKLSMGQKRAVSIASVIAMDPDILVMDEPSSNLDPRSRRQLIQLLNTFDHSKIIASHDLDMVLELCERTIILGEGRVAADGRTRELFSDEKLLAENGLEKPLSLQYQRLRVAK
ncbi:MAG: ABC transporter ATP-binding protein [Desulfobacterales bacterium]|jgi:cobalt/nickel transport system ATP-binding protein|nr:MAG: ABC transporter ATP-binding protein [Desulfobacterales bacterium]